MTPNILTGVITYLVIPISNDMGTVFDGGVHYTQQVDACESTDKQ